MRYTSFIDALNYYAEHTPNRPALKYSNKDCTESVSYAELRGLVYQYKEHLKTTFGLNEARVIVCLDNSPEYIACLYACWSLSYQVIPLHSQSKRREIEHIANFAEADLIICREKSGHTDVVPHSFCPELLPTKNEVSQGEISISTPQKSEIALILFTSGTTGNPKGVMLSHGNLLANAESIVSYLNLTNEDETYCVLPFTYSYGNSLLQTHIFAGACLHLGSSMLYPEKIAEALRLESITGFSGVPSTFQILLHKTSFAKKPPTLRYITQAGGAMNITTTKQLISLLPKTDIYVMYGQTEASARLSYLPPEHIVDKVGSIGIAIPGVELEVVSEDGSPVNTGEKGELVAKGENIMTGYLNNIEATEETLKNDWLHTGDMAYKDEDGYFFIQGRKKQMIKSGANRIHPEEIEEVITECDQVSEVAVTGLEDELLGEVIAAFLIVKPGFEKNEKLIRAHCRKQLPPHKQPKSLIWVEELPKTSSGKVQRHKLSAN